MAIGESRREVRIAWIGFAVIFGVLALLLWYKGKGLWPWFASVSGFFAFFAAVAPMALLPLYRLWVKFALKLAWFNTHLLLALLYYLVMTPTGLVMRLFGKDILDLKIEKERKSYWKKREPHDPAHYEKQF